MYYRVLPRNSRYTCKWVLPLLKSIIIMSSNQYHTTLNQRHLHVGAYIIMCTYMHPGTLIHIHVCTCIIIGICYDVNVHTYASQLHVHVCRVHAYTYIHTYMYSTCIIMLQLKPLEHGWISIIGIFLCNRYIQMYTCHSLGAICLKKFSGENLYIRLYDAYSKVVSISFM